MDIHINGARLHVEELSGDPTSPPILALQGGPGLDLTYLRDGLRGLPRRVILFDPLGTGASDRPASLPGGMAERAEEVIAVADALGLGRFVLFGHSWGGYVAQEVARRHADRLAGLILANTAPAFDYPDVVVANAQRRATPEQLAVALGALGAPMPDDATYATVWAAILPLYFHHLDAETAARMTSPRRFSALGLNHGMGVCLPGWDSRAWLPEVTVPTLLLGTDDDWICPVAQGLARLAAAMPRAQQHVFPACGHFPMIEAEDAFRAVVTDWLARAAQ